MSNIIIVRVYRFSLFSNGPCGPSVSLELPQLDVNHGLGLEQLPEQLLSSSRPTVDPFWVVIVTILLYFFYSASFKEDSHLEEKESYNLGFDKDWPLLSDVESDLKEVVSTPAIPDLKPDFAIDDTWNLDTSKLTVSSHVEDGVNGVYFVKNSEDEGVFGVFKPAEEEAFAPENRKDRIGNLNEESPLKSGAYVGEAFKKEVAAYLLDHDGFARVPETKLISMQTSESDAKLGSLQRFVKNEGSSEDFSPSKFSVRDVHAIGLLDTRIGNLDRHSGNLLAVPFGKDLSLVPIDHGFSLPDYRKMKDITFDWLSWKQASSPFSDETKQYIDSLDLVADARILTKLGLRDESIVSYLMCSTFTKEAVERGWTLKMIGEFMQRDLINDEVPSKFEALIDEYIALHNFQGINFKDGCEKQQLLDFMDTFKQACVNNIM